MCHVRRPRQPQCVLVWSILLRATGEVRRRPSAETLPNAAASVTAFRRSAMNRSHSFRAIHLRRRWGSDLAREASRRLRVPSELEPFQVRRRATRQFWRRATGHEAVLPMKGNWKPPKLAMDRANLRDTRATSFADDLGSEPISARHRNAAAATFALRHRTRARLAFAFLVLPNVVVHLQGRRLDTMQSPATVAATLSGATACSAAVALAVHWHRLTWSGFVVSRVVHRGDHH